MAEIERLTECIQWIDLSFVERERTPDWAIQVGIRCHLAGMSLRDASQFLERLGVERSHVAIHDWVHKAELQPVSTVSGEQLAVDEKVIRVNGNDYWLYGAVDPESSEILHVRLFPTTTKQTTRWVLADLHRQYELTDVESECYRTGLLGNRTTNIIVCKQFQPCRSTDSRIVAPSPRRPSQLTPNLTRP